ncbi:MAG: type IX secretion system plug protein [Bacteroidia bacterium]
MRFTAFFLGVCLFFPAGNSLAQNDDYVDDNQLRYEDYVYKPNIKTVQLYESSWEASLPLLEFNSGQQLLLSFDDLDLDRKQYTMTIAHCDYNWNPSDLMISEYLGGFYELNLLNFQYSVNTLQKYVHYSILFPSQNMQLLRSGNYVVYVYQDGNKDKLVLSRRFMVFDNKVTVTATVRQPVGNDKQYTGQHIDFNILNPGYDIMNPYTDLKVVLTQNNRWDNAVSNIKPTFVAPGQLTYSLDDASTFNGGNEFRYFDTRSLRTYTERIQNIRKDSAYKYHVDLTPDASRADKNYLFYNDINGSFLIKNQDASTGDQTVEADYVWIHFFIPYDNPIAGGNLYVLGKLTNWKLDKANRMTYNYKRFGYECAIYVKQGYYNYIYAYLPDKTKAGDETFLEGNHWDTENDYTIYVYYRQRATYYDQLICIKKFNSLIK